MLPVIKMLEMKDGELMAFLGRRAKRVAWCRSTGICYRESLFWGRFELPDLSACGLAKTTTISGVASLPQSPNGPALGEFYNIVALHSTKPAQNNSRRETSG